MLAPPFILSLPIQHPNDMTHGRTCQRTITIPSLEDRDDFSASVLVGEGDDIFCIARKE